MQREEAPLLGEFLHPNGKTKVFARAGSLLEHFVGDAMVNAANEGCVGGFGIDEQLNRAAGNYEIKEARKKLGGCPTGQARSTDSFGLQQQCQYIIHAVGPVYRRKIGHSEPDFGQLDQLLQSAYRSALLEAGRLGVKSVGFCLLSAGVFRGERDLQDIVGIALDTLLEDSKDCPDSLESITIFAYTKEERVSMTAAVKSRANRVNG
jgi:O-acetyl-ADP-ribose deacetylase